MGKSVLNQTEISDSTRKKVLERQRNVSVFGNWLGSGCQFHHVVNSGLGVKGVGYEWNVVALTPIEHRAIHDHLPIKVNGRERYTYEEAITIIRNHLKVHYSNWNEQMCKVHKGWEENDYQVVRME